MATKKRFQTNPHSIWIGFGSYILAQTNQFNWEQRDKDINRKSCQNVSIWHTSVTAASASVSVNFERVSESRVLTVNIIFISTKSNWNRRLDCSVALHFAIFPSLFCFIRPIYVLGHIKDGKREQDFPSIFKSFQISTRRLFPVNLSIFVFCNHKYGNPYRKQ